MKPYNEEQTKKEQVEQMFDNIAPTYDKLNHIMSLNIDRMWRRRVVRIIRRAEAERILDVATGTGDLAIAMAKRCKQAHILGVDLSEEMLAVARTKIAKQCLGERIAVEKGDAEQLRMVADSSVDAVTVAFGVRNFENLPKGLTEMLRVLKPGGKLVILELSIPRNPIIRWGYKLYFLKIIPAIGGCVSGNRSAYEYLPSSVLRFPAPEKFMEMMQEAGFEQVRKKSFTMGICHMYLGIKK